MEGHGEEKDTCALSCCSSLPRWTGSSARPCLPRAWAPSYFSSFSLDRCDPLIYIRCPRPRLGLHAGALGPCRPADLCPGQPLLPGGPRPLGQPCSAGHPSGLHRSRLSKTLPRVFQARPSDASGVIRCRNLMAPAASVPSGSRDPAVIHSLALPTRVPALRRARSLHGGGLHWTKQGSGILCLETGCKPESS